MKVLSGILVNLARALNPQSQNPTATSDTLIELQPRLAAVATIPGGARAYFNAAPATTLYSDTWFHRSSFNQVGAVGGTLSVLGGLSQGVWRLVGNLTVAFTGTKNGAKFVEFQLDGSTGLPTNQGNMDLVRATYAAGIAVYPIDLTLTILESGVDLGSGQGKPSLQISSQATVAGDDLAVSWAMSMLRLY